MTDFAQFYQNGGVLMHPVALCGVVAFLALARQFVTLWKTSPGRGGSGFPVDRSHVRLATALAHTGVLIGALGTLFGFIDMFAALDAVPPENWNAGFARGSKIAVGPLVFGLMWAVPLTLLAAPMRFAAMRRRSPEVPIAP
jgi:hypothetical protein